MSFGGQPPRYGEPPRPVYGQPPTPVYGQPPHPVRGQDARTPAAQSAAGPAAVFAGSSAGAPATSPLPAPQPVTPAAAMPALAMPVRKGRSVSIWLFGVLGFAMLALIAYFARFLGAGASIVGLLLALVPLGIVLFGVRLIDRWEPEPRSLVVFALAWGAVAAVGLSLLFDLLLTVAAGIRNPFFTGVVQAPFIEEVAKGLGVFLVFVIGRRAFDGPVDGVVYGALVGAGFAFTENIQYFGISLVTGGAGELTLTFILRGLVSPFAHAMFTALTGFAIGVVVRRGANTAGALGAGALGALGAVALHAFWNGSSLLGDFTVLYLTTQVPLFVVFILVIVALRREEARLTQRRLGDYAAAGWFTPEEVVMLATPAGRRVGLQWAAALPGDRRALMRSFIRDAAALAAVRQRAINGHDAYAAADEQALLARTRVTRAQLLAY
ncbi:PrsW family intramembrane metalloprotease [Microbacterium sp. MAHUQ-60]|uniref:PrsW family intramembrane metalloprotease n=1 Tax=unclassified Microbacterium TaxID=2609290 RepID=UPI003621A005